MKSPSYLGQGYNPDRFHPGYLEVFYGPMKANKSGHLIKRVDAFNYSGGLEYIAFKPEEDKRTPGKIVSRMGASDEIVLEITAIDIPADNPYKAKGYIQDKHGLIVIDEGQLFGAGIVLLVESLLAEKRNVIVAGLNLDFRGEIFGSMSYFITHADYPHPLFAACAYRLPDDSGKLVPCSQRAQFTQRLIDGEPAPYNGNIIVLEERESFLMNNVPTQEQKKVHITYEPRCRVHHTVPGKSRNDGKK
jgi:thymidine kinase